MANYKLYKTILRYERLFKNRLKTRLQMIEITAYTYIQMIYISLWEDGIFIRIEFLNDTCYLISELSVYLVL